MHHKIGGHDEASTSTVWRQSVRCDKHSERWEFAFTTGRHDNSGTSMGSSAGQPSEGIERFTDQTVPIPHRSDCPGRPRGHSMSFLRRLLGKPTIEEFGDRLVRALRKAAPTDGFRHEAVDHLIIRIRDDKEDGITNLGNVYQTHLTIPRRHRAEHLRHCVRVALSSDRKLPSEFDQARPNLRSRLWTRAGFEQMRLKNLYSEGDTGGLDLPSQPVGEHLLACLAYDWPESVQTINDDNLREWGVTNYEALEAALENLEGSIIATSKIGDRLYSFITGDTYDAARLMLVERIKDFELDGAPVAMVPNRESIYITGSDDDVGLEILASLAVKGLGEPYPLSGVPMILQDGEWVDWMPPPSCPSYAKFHELALSFVGSLNDEQKQLLDAAHQRAGIDIFVADLMVRKRPDGSLVSYCVWGEGVDYLLPVPEKVVLVREQPGIVAVGEWETVFDIVGHLMELTDHYPRRYRVRDFPDQASLDAIGMAAL